MGIEAEGDKIELLLKELDGKDVNDVIAEGALSSAAEFCMAANMCKAKVRCFSVSCSQGVSATAGVTTGF